MSIKPSKKQSNSSKLFTYGSAKRHVRKRFVHYPNASKDVYPVFLYSMRYKFDYYGEKLIVDPTHTIGRNNSALDLRSWNNWKDIIEKMPITVEELNISGHHECTDDFLEYLSYSDIRDSIKVIFLQKCNSISGTGFLCLGRFKLLQTLDVSENNQVTDEFIFQVTHELSHIQAMKMRKCPNITDRGLIAIANRYLQHFKELVVTHNTNITDHSIQEILYRCENIETLDIEECTRVTFVGIVVKEQGNILQYIQRKIRSLNITGCRNIQYYSLCWIGIALPYLEVFRGDHIPLLDDFIAKSILGGNTCLQEFHANACPKVSSATIAFLAETIVHVKELYLSKMDPKMTGHNANLSNWQQLFVNISQQQLLKLDVSSNTCIVDEIFQGPERQYSEYLKYLNIAQTSITSFGLVCIAQSFPRLEYLNISGIATINDSGIQAIVSCCANTLRILIANQCYLLTDMSIQLVCGYCPELLELSIAYDIEEGGHRTGVQYTDDCLEAILIKAKKLRKIVLNNQAGILFAPKVIKKLFTKSKHSSSFGVCNYSLESMSLIGCQNISGALNLIKVFQHCYALQAVWLPYHVLTLSSKEKTTTSTPNTINTNQSSTSSTATAAAATTTTTSSTGTYLQAGKQYRDHVVLSTKEYCASKSYWQESFAHTLYTQEFQSTIVDEQVEQLQSSLEIVINTKRSKVYSSTSTSSSNEEAKIIMKPLIGYQILIPHPNIMQFRYRDALVRRRLDEQRAIRIIITHYRMYCIWKKFKTTIMARRIYKIILLHHQQLIHKKRYETIYYNSYAKKLQKFFIHKILIFKRSVNIIKRKYFYYVTKKRMHYYIKQNKKIILLQKRIRGMLVRLSMGCILTQMYLKMPPIWKHIANILAPKLPSDSFLAHKNHAQKGGKSRSLAGEQQYIAGSEIPLQPVLIQKAEIVALQAKTRSLLQSIHDTQTHFHSVKNSQLDHRLNKHLKTAANGRLHAKLPILIPQSFDIHPYVSLQDGRKIDFHSASDSMFNKTFEKERKSKHFTELTHDAKSFLSGKATKSVSDAHLKLLTSAEQDYYRHREKARHAEETKQMLQKQSIPIHIYEMKYWPMTQQSVETKKTQVNLSMQELYNPHSNNFELIMYNSRDILYCVHCQSRLRMLHCATCRKEFCFYCAIKMHATLLERNHTMQMVEPRIVVNTTPSHSLLYHIDTSKSIVYDLQNIIKFLKSTSELQAMQRERDMLKKMEKEQEDLRLEMLIKTNEYQARFDNATRISLLYRVWKAKEIVRKRRMQVAMERWLQTITKYMLGHLKLTKLCRKFVIRLWLYRKGFIFKGIPKYTQRNKQGEVKLMEIKKKSNNVEKTILSEEKDQLTQQILTRRIFYQRTMLFGKMEAKYIQTIQMCEADIDYWKRKYVENIIPAVKKLSTLRDLYHTEYQDKQQAFMVKNLSNSARQKEENDKIIKYLHEKYENMQERLENFKNMSWWLLQHLRFLYRKSLLLPVRLHDLTLQLLWIQEEYVLLQRLEDQTKRRIEAQAVLMQMNVKEKSLYESAKEWLEEHLPYITDQQIALDGQQQSVVEDENIRLDKDIHDIQSFDALLQELIEALYVDNQWQGEKLGLERDMIYVIYGSKESVRYNEQLITLKTKQKYLQSGTIDSLKIGLQEKYDLYDQGTLESYAFLHDSPEFTLDELITSMEEKKIVCKLLHPFTASSHITVAHYIQLYSLQPWVSKHAIEDIRFQERLDAKIVKYGQLQEEMDGLEHKINDAEQTKRTLEKTVRELQVRIEALRDPPGPKETVFEKQAREKEFNECTMELKEREIDDSSNEVCLKDYRLMDGPLQFQMDQLNQEIDELEGILKERKATRDKSIKTFFEFERSFCQKEMQNLQSTIPTLEDSNAQVELQYDKAMQMYDMNRGVAVENRNDIDHIHWPDFFFIAPFTWELQQLQTQQSPHQYISVTQAAAVMIQIKAHWLRTKLDVQKNFVENLMTEKAFFNQYVTQQSKFETCLVQYIDELQFHKKQRSLELDLLIRQERLKALYQTRLKAMIKYKQELLYQEEQERVAREEALKNKKSVVVQLAQNTKKAIRGVNDKIRELRNNAETALDEEETRMHKNIMEKNKDTLGARPEGIRNIHFTCSMDETETYQRLQDHLQSKALPYFRRMERSIGNQIFLWYEMTYNPDDFITELLLTHKDPMHDYYRDLTKEKYIQIEVGNCNLVIWYKRNKRSNHGFKRLNIALTDQEEIRFGVDGYVKMEPKLVCFEPLPDLALWYLRSHKRKVIAAANTDAVIGEIMNVREMMVRHPKDANLPMLLTRLNKELEGCYKREVSNEVTNPIKVAVELMALNEEDMELWLQAFERIDVEHRGKITIEEVFEYIGLVLTDIAREVFVTVDAFDQDNLIEFGDFLRAVGTFCFFGKDEIIRFLYVYCDTYRKGFIEFAHFQKFIHMMHPYEKVRAIRCLNGLAKEPDYLITYEEFHRWNGQYPALYLPIFLIQDALRQKTLGVDWWFSKLSKYSNVRNKMVRAGDNTDQLVAVEVQRFNEDETKRVRMRQRERDIKNEQSDVRKTILQARQFLDEVS